MVVTQLDIEGFRSLKKVTWRPGDLNVIIGPNGSGKSNLLRVLEMISVIAQGHLRDYVLSAGGLVAMLWDGQAKHVILHLDTAPDNLRYEIELVRVNARYSFFIRREVLMQTQQKLVYLERTEQQAYLRDEDGAIGVDIETTRQDESVLADAARPFMRTGNEPIGLFQNALERWTVYNDIRVDQEATIRQSSVSRFEESVAPDGENLINVLHTLYTSNRDFKQQVNSAMTAAFGDDFDELMFPPASDQRVQLRVRWKTLKREQSAADLSDGTLRFLFLLAVLANPNPPPLIAIDEPETGLHPSMLPIIAELAVDASERTQVVFTTHSDQFLDAFRDTRPTTTVARWENGETTLTTLSDEDLDYWLKDYSLGKMFRSGELEALA